MGMMNISFVSTSISKTKQRQAEEGAFFWMEVLL